MQKLETEFHLAELLLASQNGDANSYSQFLSEASEVLTPFIKKKVRSSEIVDDLLQETLLAIHKSRHTYLPERSVMAWMYVICDHRITDFYRKYRRLEKREVYMFADLEDESVKVSESAELLEELMSKISVSQREIIHMLKLEGLSIKEVSSKTGLSESNVKVTAFRGYEAMKRLKGITEYE